MPLVLELPGGEGWDEVKCEFVYAEPKRLVLEHSLRAVAAWEAKFCKPFIGKQVNGDEFKYYIVCMVVEGSITVNDLAFIGADKIQEIMDYINAPASATIITEKQMKEAQLRAAKKNKKSGSPSKPKDIVTADIIYYWMIEAGIPFTCDAWNLNRLMTLIQVINLKEAGGQTMPKKELMSQNAQINAARRAAMNSSG